MTTLEKIASLVEKRKAVDEELTAALKRARKKGISWHRIGETLGLTRQHAWSLYHKKVESGE